MPGAGCNPVRMIRSESKMTKACSKSENDRSFVPISICSYGDLGNAELLRRFGFVEPQPNPHDCAQVSANEDGPALSQTLLGILLPT